MDESDDSDFIPAKKASRGKQFLIVGTKNKEADSVAWAAIRASVIMLIKNGSVDTFRHHFVEKP
ncbi:hypothetical protein R6Q59_031968 [Mikania micrantha]